MSVTPEQNLSQKQNHFVVSCLPICKISTVHLIKLLRYQDFKNRAIGLVENVLDYNLRTRFSPGMHFREDNKTDHSASKLKKC